MRCKGGQLCPTSPQRNGPSLDVVAPGNDTKLVGAFGPQGFHDGPRQLQVRDERNPGIHGAAADQVAIGSALLVVFLRSVDDEVDAATGSPISSTINLASSAKLHLSAIGPSDSSTPAVGNRKLS